MLCLTSWRLLQVGTEQATKTIEGYVLAASVGEGGLIRAMKVLPLSQSACCLLLC